ncbi:B3 domain-containing protein Os01g0905400-like isoform X2 [Panicum virgatum]|uniref:B3 domain-containing protein Os01g0905400-like isoform X2 n=1 Tax=Panicum virgatum TaxID=38727 RepID=UPI0019D63FD7|nr:B3 domain-containing protein Os01g0905400-like isoform X2 [Panicum virgatum]
MMELIEGGAVKKEPEETVVEIDIEGEEAEKVVKRRRKKSCDPHQNRACVDCKKRCARIHGRAASSSPSPSSSKTRPIPAVPSFFKVMMGYFSEHMDIPPPFARTILDLAGSNIYLEDAFGLRWRVRLCLRDGVLSFGHGWKNFVLDHAVSCGEFLVFRQIARSVFTVQMFAPSAVERLFLCEKNKRQSRKRKPRKKTSCPSSQTEKISKNCKKKQRTDHHNDLGPKDCQMQDHVFIDDSDLPHSASELKCSETSGGVPEVGVTEPKEDSEPPTRHSDCKAQEVLDGEAEIEDDCRVFEEKESECNARVIQHLVSDATEIEHGDGLNLPTNTDAIGPLAMMDLNGVNIDDIFLSADIYEFENDMCNPEAFSVDLNVGGPITTAQTSGFSCLEDTQQNHFSSIGDDQRFVMPETLSCTENKQMTDALGTGTGYACVAVNEIDINALPANEPSSFAKENSSSPPADPEVHSSECVLSGCNKDNDLLCCKDSQAERKEVKHDKQQDGQGNKQDRTGQNTSEVISSSPKLHEHPHLCQNLHQTENNSEDIGCGTSESGGVLALAASSSKFCIAVPAPEQTWLELPTRLPVIPRTKKQGRKVVILRDPCMRLWPVVYQCTPRFSGFITGWVDICRENNLHEGDTCEFELSGNSELSFQVCVPNLL